MFKVWNGQLPIAIGGSHMLLWRFFAVFIVTRAESYRFLDFYGCWAGGQLVRLQPRNAPNVYKTQTECWVDTRISDVFQPFRSLLILKQTSLWTSGTKCLYCVSNWSNLCLKLLKKISILSQTCLGQNVSIWSQFETFLTFETQLRLPLFKSNLRAIWDIFLRCQKGLKHVSKRDLGDLVDRWWIDGLFRYLVFTFKLYDFTIRIVWYIVQ